MHIQVNLLVAIEDQAKVACAEFNPQNCANLLWGFAKLRQPTATLLPAVMKRLQNEKIFLQCKPVEVSRRLPSRCSGAFGLS